MRGMQRATLDAIERAWERANDVPDDAPERDDADASDDGFDPPDADDYVDGEGDGELTW